MLDFYDKLVRFAVIAVCFLSSLPNFVQISRIIAENDPHFVLDVRLITSCELTSGSVFRRGHLRVVVLHLCVKCYASSTRGVNLTPMSVRRY